MDGIEKIIGRINAAAAEECAAIAQKSQQDCDALRAEYAQKVRSAYESAVQSGQLDISLDAERVIRNAKLAARKELLSAKQQLLDAAFDAAKQRFCQLPEGEYLDWMAAMLSKASDGKGEIILAARDRALGEKLAAKANEALEAKGKKGELTVSSETREIDAGFVLRDGKLEINCTLDAILEMNRQGLAAKVAEELFG